MNRFTPLLLLLFACLSFSSYAADKASNDQDAIARKILEGARDEVRNGTEYGAAGYIEIPYPGGDVISSMGVCTDLVVRAFRNAGFDLQKLVYEDHVKRPDAYPTHRYDEKEPDPNIDHRRCSNLVVFFDKYAKRLTTSLDRDYLKEWKAGDVVFFIKKDEKYPWHVAIISDRRTPNGLPYIVHLFPIRASEVPIKYFLPIYRHYRWTGSEKAAARKAQSKKPSKKQPSLAREG